MQYLYWDMGLNFFFILVIGYTGTPERLSIDRPRHSLFSLTNCVQVLVAFSLQLIGQISAIGIYTAVEPDYYTRYGGMENAIENYHSLGWFPNGKLESDVMFLFVNNVYVAMMLAFNIAQPWRKPFYTNLPLMISVVVTLFYNQVLLLWEGGTWSEFEINYLPSFRIRVVLLLTSWAFSAVIFINQKIVMEPFSNYLVKKYPQKKWL